MKVRSRPEIKVQGVSTRTRNDAEMNPETAKIPGLWQRFHGEVLPAAPAESTTYGVYSDYESDHMGEYTLTVGVAPAPSEANTAFDEATIPAGDYVVFEGRGELPGVVIQTWLAIWQHFADADAAHQRAFTTDYECYVDGGVDIHIAVRPR